MEVNLYSQFSVNDTLRLRGSIKMHSLIFINCIRRGCRTILDLITPQGKHISRITFTRTQQNDEFGISHLNYPIVNGFDIGRLVGLGK